MKGIKYIESTVDVTYTMGYSEEDSFCKPIKFLDQVNKRSHAKI